MRSLLLGFIGVAATACVQPLIQPEPQLIASAFVPAEVVRRAAAAVTGLGFEVTVSDADAGVLTAKRVRGPGANDDLLTCRWSDGSIADTHGATTITISLSARPTERGADVVLGTRTVASFPSLSGGALAMPDNEESCVSNGRTEAAVVAAVAP